jgi:hypothetical protein
VIPLKRATAALAVLVGVMLAIAAPASAAAAKQFDFGFADDRFSDNLFTSQNANVRAKWLGRAADANGRFARINAYWSIIATGQPGDPTNPSDPAYDWSEIDRAVSSADAEGLEVILLVLNAPSWAEGAGRPYDPELRTGNWKPSPTALADFAKAIATRYSGSFGGLPQVRYYEGWNEPNLRNYLSPLWNGKRPAAPAIYRDLLNGFYEGIKSVSGSNLVVTGGTSPFGDGPGGRRMRPLFFWRKVLCLNKKLKQNCNHTTNFDIFGHNGINAPGDGPTQAARHPDDATPADFGDIRKMVRAAEKRGTAPGGGHDIWSTETWYESKPPQRKALPLKAQARAMVGSMYVLWKQGAEAVIFLQLRDSPYDPKRHPLLGFQTGIYFLNNKAKPSAKAIEFPFVAERKGQKPTILWGIAPRSGKLRIEQKTGGRWKKVAAKRATAGKVFNLKSGRVNGKRVKLRARVGNEMSMLWKLR